MVYPAAGSDPNQMKQKDFVEGRKSNYYFLKPSSEDLMAFQNKEEAGDNSGNHALLQSKKVSQQTLPSINVLTKCKSNPELDKLAEIALPGKGKMDFFHRNNENPLKKPKNSPIKLLGTEMINNTKTINRKGVTADIIKELEYCYNN